jgi:hypothetical protein
MTEKIVFLNRKVKKVFLKTFSQFKVEDEFFFFFPKGGGKENSPLLAVWGVPFQKRHKKGGGETWYLKFLKEKDP